MESHLLVMVYDTIQKDLCRDGGIGRRAGLKIL